MRCNYELLHSPVGEANTSIEGYRSRHGEINRLSFPNGWVCETDRQRGRRVDIQATCT
jgi:hypothetical protein